MTKFDFRIGDKVRLRNGNTNTVIETRDNKYANYPIILYNEDSYAIDGSFTFYFIKHGLDIVENISQTERENMSKQYIAFLFGK